MQNCAFNPNLCLWPCASLKSHHEGRVLLDWKLATPTWLMIASWYARRYPFSVNHIPLNCSGFAPVQPLSYLAALKILWLVQLHKIFDFLAFLKLPWFLLSINLWCQVLSAHVKYPVIPKRVTIGKRLAQCLHPALPSGVHLKALETYDIIFKCIGTPRLASDLFTYSAGMCICTLTLSPWF